MLQAFDCIINIGVQVKGKCCTQYLLLSLYTKHLQWKVFVIRWSLLHLFITCWIQMSNKCQRTFDGCICLVYSYNSRVSNILDWQGWAILPIHVNYIVENLFELCIEFTVLFTGIIHSWHDMDVSLMWVCVTIRQWM